MNIAGTLSTVGFALLAYTTGIIHATDSLSTAYGLPTEAARSAAPVVVEPALLGGALIAAGTTAYAASN